MCFHLIDKKVKGRKNCIKVSVKHLYPHVEVEMLEDFDLWCALFGAYESLKAKKNATKV